MPQPFNKAIMTNSGVNLLLKAQAGEAAIQFTRMAIGSGKYSETDKILQNMKMVTNLREEKNSYSLSSIKIESKNSVKITALISNQDTVLLNNIVDEGFYINEIGVFAKDKESDAEEILYSIAVVSGETGDFMPPYNGFSPVHILQDYFVTVNNAADVTIVTEKAIIPVDELKEVINNELTRTIPSDAVFTDTKYTAGRQLSLSENTFNLSDYCMEINNWNEATTNGWYYSKAKALYSPSNNENCIGFVCALEGNSAVQLAWGMSSGNEYHRFKNFGMYGNWINIKNTDTKYTAGSQLELNGTEFNLTTREITNWNDATKTGFYVSGSNTKNSPAPLNFTGIVINNGEYVVQILYNYKDVAFENVQVCFTRKGKPTSDGYVWLPYVDQTIQQNSKEYTGFVTKGDGHSNQIWKTDYNGNPAWRSLFPTDIGAAEYEEGAWTPKVCYNKSGFLSELETINKKGFYVKTGALIYLKGFVTLSESFDTDYFYIQNLPFYKISNDTNSGPETGNAYFLPETKTPDKLTLYASDRISFYGSNTLMLYKDTGTATKTLRFSIIYSIYE